MNQMVQLPGLRQMFAMLAVVGLVGSAGACKGSEIVGTERVATIEVTPASTSVPVGTVMPLSVSLRGENGQPVTRQLVHWSSSDTVVARVSSAGVVTALSAGDVQIAATAQGISAVANVHVSGPPPVTQQTLTRILVSPTTAVIKSTGSQEFRRVQLTATAYDQADRVIEGRTFTWSSSKSTTATVSSSGLVVGWSTGKVTITASADGKSGTATVEVVR
jgi:large repetitive protein